MADSNNMTPQGEKQSLLRESFQKYMDYLSKNSQANVLAGVPSAAIYYAPMSLLGTAVDRIDSAINPIRTLPKSNKAVYGGLLAEPSPGLTTAGLLGLGSGGTLARATPMPWPCTTCHVPPSPPNTTQATAPPASPPGIPAPAPVYDKSGREVNPLAESLKPPGNCNQWDYDRLKNSVDTLCKGDKRTCRGVSDPIQLQLNRFANKDCAEARDNINNTCFAGGNLTHRDAAIDAWTAMKICEEKIK